MNGDLKKKILELSKSEDYDCLLMFSGGKDSSYLLYYLSQELGLRVITITLTHNFLSRETLDNIESFARRYSTKHITIENKILNHSAKHFLEAWINDPEEGSLITFCTGCRLGLSEIVIDTALKEKVNVIITGLTPFEATDYRTKLVNFPKGKDGKLFFFLGYMRLIIRNPSLILNWKALKCQAKEYYYHINQNYAYTNRILDKKGLSVVIPFYHYVKYNEEMIIETLKKLNWQKAPVSSVSYWRADCNMNAVRQFFHHKLSGYNELKAYYGRMLKENLITQEYYDKNIQEHYSQSDILKILKGSGISEKAFRKYEKYLTGA